MQIYVCKIVVIIYLNIFFILVATRLRYNQLLYKQNTSIRKQLISLREQLPTQYKCLVVHTLKCQANPVKVDDR